MNTAKIYHKEESDKVLKLELKTNSAIAALSKKLLCALDVEEISFQILKVARELTDSENGFIAYRDPKTNRLVCPSIPLKYKETYSNPLNLTNPLNFMEPGREPILVNKPAASSPGMAVVPYNHCHISRFISVPALLNGQVAGQLMVANASREYTNRDLATIEQLADLYAIALQRNLTEFTLRESEKHYNIIVNGISDVFVLCEVSCLGLKVLKTNDIALKLINRKEEEVNGKYIQDLLPRETAEVWLLNSEKVIAEGKPRVYESNNQFGIFEVKSVPIFNEMGTCTNLIITAREISEKKKMEEHLMKMEKLESVGLLAGGIAHDFNNILTAIIGNTSLAKLKLGNDGDGKVLNLLREIEQASLGAKDLTQQLLTFAKGGTPVLSTVPIGELLRESATFSLRGSNVKCTFNIAEDLWAADIDQGQINQVINNLVINAVHAMKGGGNIEITAKNITIDCYCSLPLKNGRYVKISLKDYGEGIPSEHLDKLFDPYFTTKQMGTGLGLTTSYSIIRKHNGYITVNSALGAGTTFSIYLPASENKPQYPIEQIVKTDARGKILVMDDEKMVRFVLSEMLSHLGYEPACAKDGVEAINMYRDSSLSGDPFQGVIMDLTIPGGMGGKEAIKQLLDFDPEVKAIVSSGYSNDPVMSNHTEYGFKAVITKPYSIEQLGTTLDNLLTNTQTEN